MNNKTNMTGRICITILRIGRKWITARLISILIPFGHIRTLLLPDCIPNYIKFEYRKITIDSHDNCPQKSC